MNAYKEPSPFGLPKVRGREDVVSILKDRQHLKGQTGKLLDIAWKKTTKIRGMC